MAAERLAISGNRDHESTRRRIEVEESSDLRAGNINLAMASDGSRRTRLQIRSYRLRGRPCFQQT
jgi:hypothetical protein